MGKVLYEPIRSGESFGKWLALRPATKKEIGKRAQKARPNTKWILCECQCPLKTRRPVVSWSLRRGDTKSCGLCRVGGCWGLKTQYGIPPKDRSQTRTYSTWAGMRSRAKAEGVPVIKRWDNYQNFLDDMGEKPEGMLLYRRDTSKGFNRRNCRWATYLEFNSTSPNIHWVRLGSRFKSLTEAARRLGMHPRSLRSRLKNGTAYKLGVTEL